MKSQEQIIFEHVCLKLELSEYKTGKINSLANILHWLYALHFRHTDIVTIGWNPFHDHGEVTLYKQCIATFTIDYDRQMPIFKFIEEYRIVEEWQRHYIDGLTLYKNPYVPKTKA